MSRFVTLLGALGTTLALGNVALANNSFNTSYRAGTISPPSVDASPNNASTVAVNQGRAGYSFAFAAPPGRKGVEPSLSLVYTGGHSDGLVGAGWDLAIPSIRVRTSGRGGQPSWGVAVRYLGLTGEELVQLAADLPDVDGDGLVEATYREERDTTFARFVELSAGGWMIQYADGRKLTLGTDANQRIARVGAPTEIAQWLPERLEDPSGNQLTWHWSTADEVASDLGVVALSDVTRYLTEMRWGCHECESASTYQKLELSYADLAENTFDFGPGFLVEREFELAAVDTATVVAGAATPVRTYSLAYHGDDTHRLLASVTTTAADGTQLPPVTFGYSTRNAGPTSASVTSPPGALFAAGTQPVDIDLDGRPDVAKLGNVGTGITYYLHQGTTAPTFASGANVNNADKPGVSLTATGTASAEDATRDIAIDVFDLTTGMIYAHNHARGWADGVAADLPVLTSNPDTVRIDVNADGYVDLVDTALSPWEIWLDDGSHSFTSDRIVLSNDTTPTVGVALRASSDGVLFGDLNGDGLIDVVYLDPTGASAQVFYGRGRGGFGWLPEDNRDDGVQSSPLTITSSVGAPVRSSSVLADIDGDGLADLVSFDTAAGRLRVWKRVPGHGFTDASTSSPLTQAITSASGCRIHDWDMDAVSEIMCSTGWKLYDWADSVPFLLTEVDNGRGSVTRIDYTTTARVAATHAAAQHAWSTNLATALPVVAHLENDDGRGNVAVTTYDYRDARYEADELRDRFEFMGFRFVASEVIAYLETTPGSVASRVVDPQDPGVLTRTFFDVGATDYDQRGMLDCEETWARGDAPDDSFSCDVAAQGPLARRVQAHSATVDADGIATIHVDSEDRYVLEGGSVAAGARLHTEYEYDDFGNRTAERSYGTDAPGDEVMTVTEFVHDTDDWFVGLPRVVRHGDIDGSGALIQRAATCSIYDGVTAMCDDGYDGGEDYDVELGLVTETMVYTDDDPMDGVGGTMVTTGTATYTANALPDYVTDASGVATQYGYDTAFGLFMASTTLDPGGLALATLFQISTKHGQTTRVTFPDGTFTRAVYDDLGRFTRLYRAGDIPSAPSLVRSYALSAPESTITDVQKDGTADGLTTIRHVDGAGHVLCEDKEGVATRNITGQHEFSGRGLEVMTYLPAQAAGCDFATRSATGRTSVRPHDATDYDALARASELEHRPSGARVVTEYGVLLTTTNDENDNDPGSPHVGTPTDTITDGLGRVTAIVEHVDGDGDGAKEPFTTSYAYDAIGLVAVTDPSGVTIFESAYDSRGRRVWQRDADRGEESRTYDNADRIASLLDARGSLVSYVYDHAGRISTLTADDGTTADVIAYHYDQHPGGAAATSSCHTAGQLAWVEDPSGQSVFCYDELARITREDTTISAYSATPFVTRRKFDAMDRLEQLTYPDNTKLSYGYGAHGYPTSLGITSGTATFQLVTSASYDAVGRPTALSYGNAVAIDIGYDDRQRVNRHAASAGGSPELELVLGIDGVGNVESVTDSLGARSAHFVYDDWNRLVLASGDFVLGETISYAYDVRGNLIAQTSSDPSWPLQIDELTYGDATAVHALTAVDRNGDGVDDESFAYDEAGNLAEDGAHAFEFDALGRLHAIENLTGTSLVSYTYDYGGRRVGSAYPGNNARYFVRAANVELRKAGGVSSTRKHITFAGRTIATVNGTFTNANKATRIAMFAFDHLGAPVIAFDASAVGNVIERWASYPFGAENSDTLDAEGNLADYFAPGDPGSHLSQRFQGREIELGLPTFYDFGARVYRTDLGRFLSADSTVPDPTDSQSWNRYSFARNNPVSRTDPSGHADGDALQVQPICKADYKVEDPIIPQPPKQDFITVPTTMPAGPSMSGPLPADQVGRSPQAQFDYDTETHEAIAGGLGGTTGFNAGGDKGARVGAAVDGVLGGLSGMSEGAEANAKLGTMPHLVGSEPYVEPKPTYNGPLGSRRSPLVNERFQPARNEPAMIAGREYGGHALDSMQNRGLMPSVVEHTIEVGTRTPDPIEGRVRVYDASNNLTVILEGDRVVTVIPGER